MTIPTDLQRGGILALLAKNEGRVLLADEITRVFQDRLSRSTVYRRLGELEGLGAVERIWLWHMPMPRFGLTDHAEQVVRDLLLGVVEDAGATGISAADANAELLGRVVAWGSGLKINLLTDSDSHETS